MNKFLKVMEDVTNFIVGSESKVMKEETPMGFTTKKKKIHEEKEKVILDSLLECNVIYIVCSKNTECTT